MHTETADTHTKYFFLIPSKTSRPLGRGGVVLGANRMRPPPRFSAGPTCDI